MLITKYLVLAFIGVLRAAHEDFGIAKNSRVARVRFSTYFVLICFILIAMQSPTLTLLCLYRHTSEAFD